MKVLVLGTGKMGYGLLKDLNAQPKVTEIVAADVNLDQARAVAARVGGDKITIAKADVTHKNATVKLIKDGFDVVASALPRQFCDLAVAATIEAGVGYADIAASFATIFSHHKAAKRAGIIVVPHIGLDIGIDRVLCGVGARKLDKAERFYVACGGFPQKGTPGYYNPLSYKISWYWPLAVATNLGVNRVLKNGKMIEIPALSDAREIVFPEPLGRLEAFTTGGLNDVVEHLGLKGVKDAYAQTVRWPGHCEIWKKLKELHLLDEEPVRVKDAYVKPLDLFIALGEKTLQYGPGEGDAVCQRVEVSGVKGGKAAGYIWEFMDFYDPKNDISAMARTTAFPCSIVAQMIAKGEMDTPGVIHPVKIGYDEKLSKKFFAELKKQRISITETFRSPFN